MNISFIGGGNMASAMLGGLVKQGISPRQLNVVEIDAKSRSHLESCGYVVFSELEQTAIQGSDVVVLAVKPQQISTVARQLGPMLTNGQVVLSIAAGIRLADIGKWLQNQGANFVLVRAMPNTPALIGAGVTGLYSSPVREMLTDMQRELIEKVMGAAGSYIWIGSEEDMDAVTAISGSGPAYFFYFIEALEQAGKDLGLTEGTARKLALETALGAAKLANAEHAEAPATLRVRVTSKNGTTEKALLSLEENHVKQHIVAAAKAAAARSREIGDELGNA